MVILLTFKAFHIISWVQKFWKPNYTTKVALISGNSPGFWAKCE